MALRVVTIVAASKLVQEAGPLLRSPVQPLWEEEEEEVCDY